MIILTHYYLNNILMYGLCQVKGNRLHGFKTVPPASGMGGEKEIVMLSYILVVG
jgi:hypothetical protein